MATDLQFPLDPFFVLSKDLLAIAGFDGYFKKINPAGIELLGYTEEELLSTHINELIHPDDREETIRIRNILRNNQDILNFENRYITKNGETIWLLWTSMPIYSKKLVYAAAKNITHIKKQEEDRNTILANLTKINTDMKQLTYRVSHDLRSPVSNLVAAFSLLDESKVKDKETLEFINLLKLSTDSLNDLLNNYVETLTQETDQTNMFETLSLYEVLGKVKTSISSLIKTSGTTISVDFSEFDVVRFNKSYMESIFLNMILIPSNMLMMKENLKFLSPLRKLMGHKNYFLLIMVEVLI